MRLRRIWREPIRRARAFGVLLGALEHRTAALIFLLGACNGCVSGTSPFARTSTRAQASQAQPSQTQAGQAQASALCDDVLACEAACTNGDVTACDLVGDALAGPGGEKLHAASAFLRACERDDERACQRAGDLLREKIESSLARTIAGRYAHKLSLGCDRGDDVACAAALDVAETWEIEPLAESLAGVLSRRCHEGSASACLQLLESGDEQTESEEGLAARIVSLGRAHCATGAERDCVAVKELVDFRRREDARAEARRRAKLTSTGAPLRERVDELSAACTKKEAQGCIDLATLYLLHGMRATARHTFDAACEAALPALVVSMDADPNAAGDGLLCWNAFLMARDSSNQDSGADPFQTPWTKLHAACAGGVADACLLEKPAKAADDVKPIPASIVEAVQRGDELAFGVTRVVAERGDGVDAQDRDRVLVRVAWFATDGAPLARNDEVEVVSLDRGDAVAEALRGTRSGARVLARIAPGPLSPYAVPVVAAAEVLAIVPRAPVRALTP
jgi:hypothetical protein